MSKDLENVTCKEIRTELEKKLSCNLKEYKEYIDNEMLLILGQMDKASHIFDYLYLGSEWNASNLEELNKAGVGYILNVTREIDNFFPGLFAYHNVRVYDEESTDLLSHWNDAYNFINKAKKNHSKCLVHCKMGVSRSASTVIAYAMKEYGWSMEKAYNYVKQKRSVARPNAGFMRQLSEYEGILDASKQRHNKLWKQQQAEFESMFPSAYQPSNLESDLQYRINVEDVDDQVLPESRCFGNLPEPHGLIEPTVLLEVQDLERDALLIDPPFSDSYCSMETKEKTCNKAGRDLDLQMQEVRKKLDFETALSPEYLKDDLTSAETERKKLSAHMMYYREDQRAGMEFSNNSSSKRSCPKDSEEDAIFGILSKVKPPYPSCTDCMYSETQEECQDLDTAGLPEATTVCTQPALLQHMTSAVLDRMHGHKLVKSTPLQTDLHSFATTTSKAFDENYRDSAKLHETSGQEFCEDSKRDFKQAKDLKYLFFSKDLEKPAMHSYLMQHQESIIQLQKAGLVRKHTKELERLKSEGSTVLKESPLEKTESSKPEDVQQLPVQSVEDPTESTEKVNLPDTSDGVFQKTSTPTSCKTDLISNYTKDFLKTICYTPTSSSMSSNLTRSSSSDSIHSVRGKPGLVKQRTQEIETRMRLAGLTLSSPLKRSHSLAKLGSLNFSTDDISCDPENFQSSECKSPRLRDHLVCTDTPSSSSSTMETPSVLMESNNSSMTETDT